MSEEAKIAETTQTVQEQIPPQAPVEQIQQEETVEQINWRRAKEAKAAERRAKEEAIKRAEEKERELEALKAAFESVVNKQQPINDDMEEESEEKRIEKLLEKKLAEKEARYEQERKARDAAEMPQKLKSTFSDFSNICSQENLDYLEYHYPEVAVAFSNMPDSYDKWAALYKAVKRFVPNTNSDEAGKKAEKNLSKPQSMSAPGRAPTGDTAPTYLDERRKMDNWSRMQRVMKGG